MHCKPIRRFTTIFALLAFVSANAATLPCRNYSSSIPGQVAPMLTNLIRSALDHPTVRAIDTYAATTRWQKAGDGWITSYANCGPQFTPGIETIGGDAGNDMIFVMITLDFDPVPIIEALSKTFSLREETGVTDTISQIDKYTLSYQGDVVGQVWLERSTDLEHDTSGTAVFYSGKKLQEMMSKVKAEDPIGVR